MRFLMDRICCPPSDERTLNADNPFVNLSTDIINYIYTYVLSVSATELAIPTLYGKLINQKNIKPTPEMRCGKMIPLKKEKIPSHWINLDIEKDSILTNM